MDAAIAAAMESDGGFAVTKFNMNEERQEGNIDAEVRGWVGGGGRGAGGGGRVVVVVVVGGDGGGGWWWQGGVLGARGRRGGG